MKQQLLGQHFLLDRDAIARALDAAGLRNKTVLEIGAGSGIITEAIAERKPKKLVAIELDAGLKKKLARRLKGKNVGIKIGDVLDEDFSAYDAVVGNIPFALSSRILFKFLSSEAKTALFWLQKEFAERLCAEEGSEGWSRLGVMAQAKADAGILFVVPRYSFVPVPETDAAAVLLKRKRKPVRVDEDLVRALFQHKNQTVKNALSHSSHELGKTGDVLVAFAAETPLKDRRVRSLSLEEMRELSSAYKLISSPEGSTAEKDVLPSPSKE